MLSFISFSELESLLAQEWCNAFAKWRNT